MTGWALDPDSPNPLTTSLTVDGQPSNVVPQQATRTDIGLRYPGAGDLEQSRPDEPGCRWELGRCQ